MMSKKKIAFLIASIVMMLTLITAALFGQAVEKDNVYRYLSIFTEVFSLARSNYVDEVPSEKLVDGAFGGVTDAIDEYSYYVPPSEIAGYRKAADVSDGSVGLIVSKRFGYGYVIAPVADSPADKAGLEAGDFIEKIDGQPTQKMTIWKIRGALQGDEGKPLSLTVLRGGLSRREEFTVVRKPFAAQAPASREYGSVAYIAIPHFGGGSAENFGKLLSSVRASGKRKLIVDVRGNAGGRVEEAAAAADHLLSGGAITSLVGRKAERKRWDADKATLFDGDVQILADHSTAGPAEIFAAAIGGNKRGSVVGVSTYGMSIVQKFVPLASGGGLHVTIGHYTQPDSKPIKEQGIRPDVYVDLSALAIRGPEGAEKPKDDLILNRALKIFGESALKAAA